MAAILKGGVAFITGAAGGIGQEIAYAFARHGAAAIAVADRASVSETATHLRTNFPAVKVLELPLDVSSESQVDASVAATVEAFGRLDYAVNNAGIGGPGQTTPDVAAAEFEKCIQVNLTGVWLCQRAQLRQMRRQEPASLRAGRGSIVNIASMLGVVAASPRTPATAYTASKHAVVGMTRADAAIHGKEGIRINAVCPGYVKTALFEQVITKDVRDAEIEKVPMKRLGLMEEVADTVVFLSSTMGSFINGADILVDGGYTCQ